MASERTTSGSMIVLRALGALLDYPGAALREALPEIAAVVSDSPLLVMAARAGVLGLIALIGESDALQAEERYVDLFDRGRATSLNLFEHVHGDGRDRGAAMLDLKQVYERAGFDLATRELPDYLPVVLEYLSCRDLAEAREMLGDCAPILRALGEKLVQRGSAYSTVFAALLAVAGVPGMAVKAARRPPPRGEEAARAELDRNWEERPAFAPPEATIGAAARRRASRGEG